MLDHPLNEFSRFVRLGRRQLGEQSYRVIGMRVRCARVSTAGFPEQCARLRDELEGVRRVADNAADVLILAVTLVDKSARKGERLPRLVVRGRSGGFHLCANPDDEGACHHAATNSSAAPVAQRANCQTSVQ